MAASQAADRGSIPRIRTIHNLVGKFPHALARGNEKGVGEIRIGVGSYGEFGGRAKWNGDGFVPQLQVRSNFFEIVTNFKKVVAWNQLRGFFHIQNP